MLLIKVFIWAEHEKGFIALGPRLEAINTQLSMKFILLINDKKSFMSRMNINWGLKRKEIRRGAIIYFMSFFEIFQNSHTFDHLLHDPWVCTV